MVFDTQKTFKTNKNLWNAFAATCKLRDIDIPDRLNEIILTEVQQHKLVSNDVLSLFPEPSPEPAHAAE